MWRKLTEKLYCKGAKHGAVIRISLLQQLAYIYDFILRTFFLFLILFIFSQLWRTTYEAGNTPLIEGYTIVTLMWYLVITESIMMALPALVDKIEQEVKNGEIAYFLNRPISYLGFHFGNYFGEALVRIGINLAIGGSLIFIMFGGISVSLTTLLGFLVILLLAIGLQYVSVMIVCLGAFWVEDIRGFHLVYNRLLMILGGMMIPLEIFPDWLEQIAKVLPFQNIIYMPATFFVGMNQQSLLQIMVVQGIWLFGLALVLIAVFRLGVKRLNVNGG